MSNIVDVMRGRDKTEVTIYRGPDQILVYGPAPVVLDLIKIQLYPETYGPRAAVTDGDDIPSHTMYVKPGVGGVNYQPLLEDYCVITLSNGNDGPYVVKQYSPPDLTGPKYGQCYMLAVRFLGAKKPGDTPNKNNSGNLRLGGRF